MDFNFHREGLCNASLLLWVVDLGRWVVCLLQIKIHITLYALQCFFNSYLPLLGKAICRLRRRQIGYVVAQGMKEECDCLAISNVVCVGHECHYWEVFLLTHMQELATTHIFSTSHTRRSLFSHQNG